MPISLKRQAILDGAILCFLEHGYGLTSMDMVAAQAGVSKATIYAHFDSKSDLFASVIQRRCEEDFLIPEEWVKDGLDARTVLTRLARLVLNFMVQPHTLAIHRVVVAEAIRQPDLAAAFWDAGPSKSTSKFVELFENLDKRKLLKIPDPLVATLIFLNMLKAEFFFCRLLGLPEGTERMDFDRTVQEAVNVILKTYAP